MKTSISSLEICRNLQNSIILILICPACCTGSKAHLIVPKRLSEKPWSNKVDWSHKRSRDLRETLSRFATAFLEGTYNNQSMLLFYKILGLGIFKNSLAPLCDISTCFIIIMVEVKRTDPKFWNQVFMNQKYWKM